MIKMIKEWLMPEVINDTMKFQIALLALIGICITFIIIDSVKIIRELLRDGDNHD